MFPNAAQCSMRRPGFSSRTLSALSVGLFLLRSTLATPVNFCRHDVNLSINFCLAASTYLNTTTSATDLYLTFTTKHPALSADGWVAVGLGPSMRGALMFITYGDPESPTNQATTTVRTTVGHRPPGPLTSMMHAELIPSIQVVRSEFGPLDESDSDWSPFKLVTTEIVCYNCNAWTVTPLDTNHTQQPWIWAASTNQDFGGDLGPDVAIRKHGNVDGFGKFYANLRSAFEGPWDSPVPPPFPTLSPDYNGPVGAFVPDFHKTHFLPPESTPTPKPSLLPSKAADADTTTHTTASKPSQSSVDHASPKPPKSWRNFLWHLHGMLLILAFLLLYPAGIYFFSFATHGRNFQLHWILQALASALVLMGVVVGVVQSRRIGFFHQYLGLAIPAALLAQAGLGWRSHMLFVQTNRKSRLGWLHGWLGAAIVAAGCANAVIGLKWRGYGLLTVWLVVGSIGAEMLALAGLWWSRSRRDAARGVGGTGRATDEADQQEYALVGDSDDEDDDAEELEINERGKLMRAGGQGAAEEK